MVTISLCMIVRDEAEVLARCLESVKGLVDEIIILDTGSQDETREIAGGFTDQVHSFEWEDDFAAARNAAFSKATMDYCLWLDADDILLEEDRRGFLELKNTLPPTVDMVMMPYHVAFDEKGKPTFFYYRERLLRREAGFRWEGAVHETIVPRGEIVYSQVAVTHRKLRPSDPDRNLRIYEKLLAKGTVLDPRQQFYYGRELYYHARYPEAAQVLEQFLNGGNGWVENDIEACRNLALCHSAQGNPRAALLALLRSLEFDLPRAEICCDIGQHFLEEGRLYQAAFWYEQALRCEINGQSGGFVSSDCYGYIPCLQLCVCYDRLGDRKRAEEFNQRAAQFWPDSPACAYNRSYFSGIAEEKKSQ